MLSHGWRVPRIKIAKNSSLGAPLLRQIPNKGWLSQATALTIWYISASFDNIQPPFSPFDF